MCVKSVMCGPSYKRITLAYIYDEFSSDIRYSLFISLQTLFVTGFDNFSQYVVLASTVA